jgi:hypothetical protein
MKKLLKLLLVGLMLSTSSILPQNAITSSKVFSHGETLIYKVKWMFMRVGTITINTYKSDEDPSIIKVTMEVESNPDLFFLKVKEYNESWIDVYNLMSKNYLGDHQSGSDRMIIKSKYDPNKKIAFYSSFDAVKKSQIRSDTIYNAPFYVEGPSLFFFTRVNASPKKIVNVPTLVNGKISNTRLVFGGEKEEIEIDALPHPVRTIHYIGFADWEGGTSQAFGGEFEGWISDDEAAVPVYAELKVLLGSLKIELESWKRHGWNTIFISTNNK